MTSTVSAGVGDIGFAPLQLSKLRLVRDRIVQGPQCPAIIQEPAAERAAVERTGRVRAGARLSMSVDYPAAVAHHRSGRVDRRRDAELPLWLHRLASVRGVVDSTHYAPSSSTPAAR